MALAQGTSYMACGEPTLHTRTAMVLAEKLTAAKFTISKPVGRREADCWMISCEGAGVAAGQALVLH
jgi:RNA 3'-terminal phosphate cyclase (ATP)